MWSNEQLEQMDFIDGNLEALNVTRNHKKFSFEDNQDTFNKQEDTDDSTDVVPQKE